jgi:hypothetical protein
MNQLYPEQAPSKPNRADYCLKQLAKYIGLHRIEPKYQGMIDAYKKELDFYTQPEAV